VVGAVSAVLLGKLVGYSKAIVVGAVCYLFAFGLLRLASGKIPDTFRKPAEGAD